jgi:flagellar hook assembly protein FlgD
VVLDIVDATGRIRRRLATGVSTPGSHVVEWDGKDHRGVRVGSGVYFVSLRAGLRTATSHKLTVVR